MSVATPLTPSQVKRLTDIIETRAGMLIGADRVDLLCQAAHDVMQLHAMTDFDYFLEWVSSSSPVNNLLQGIIERIVVNETFFFRDDSQIAALRDVVLPSILEYRRETMRCLNILSAGCSTGEEPYTIAMLLDELGVGSEPWTINLTGGDISLNALAKARAAVYGEWSFRGVPKRVRDRYFTSHGQQYALHDNIKQMVSFQPLNLADGVPFSDLDLILWRNVAIYFSPDKIKEVAAHCFRALRDGGWLFVGATELSQEYFRTNEAVHIGDAIVYRKNVLRSPPPITLPPLRTTPPIEIPERRERERKPVSLMSGKDREISPSVVRIHDATRRDSASFESAELLWKQGEIKQATEMLNALTLSEPRALYLLARIHADRGDHEKAEETCSRYLDRVPDSLDGYYLLAMICQATHKEALAAEALRKTLFLDRNFVMGHWSLGVLYGKLGKAKAAQRHLKQVRSLLDKMPENQPVAYSEGQTVGRILKTTDHVLKTLSGGTV